MRQVSGKDHYDHEDAGADASKTVLRADLLAVRAGFTPDDRAVSARLFTEQAAGLPELAAARTVAAYVSFGGEPGTGGLLDALRDRGVRVLLPVLLADNDLDWALYRGLEGLRRAASGLYEPEGERLGRDAVLDAQVVLLPGLAVDTAGRRLGRGGGSYDRALARLDAAGARPALVVLLYAHEVLPAVPVEPHDRPVDAAVTPDGVRRFAR